MVAVLDSLTPGQQDFVCFPEVCLHTGADLARAVRHAESVPGPTTEILGSRCRRLDSHVLLPLLESADQNVYNTVVLLDPAGRIAGRYRKHFPTSYEMKDGVSPGQEIPVWQTVHGGVGCAVCFDLKFPEVALALARGGARLVFWPTMFRGGTRLAAWARDYGFALVSCGAWGGQVIDQHGQLIADSIFPARVAGAVEVQLVHARLNLDCKTYHLDYNRQKLADLLSKYANGLEAFLMDDEGIFTLTSTMEQRTVDQIEQEFGLVDLRSYLDKAIRDRQAILNRPTP